MCGSSQQGVQAISCGRHLANHEVNVTAYVPNSATNQLPQLRQELTLFELTDAKVATYVYG